MKYKKSPNKSVPVSILQRLIDILNKRKPHTCNTYACIYKEFKFRPHKPGRDRLVMGNYLWMLEKKSYVVREGRGKDQIILRVKHIPRVKILTKLEEKD